MTDKALVTLCRRCPLLLEIDLGQVSQITDTAVYAIFMNSTHIRELRLNQNAFLTDAGFPDLPGLMDATNQEIGLSAGKYAGIVCDPLGLHYSSSTDSSPMSEDLPGISRSDVAQTPARSEPPPAGLDFYLLRPRAETFEHLRLVDLTACALLTDIAVDHLVRNAPKLRNVTLAKCGLLTDAALESIAKLGRHLHYLHLGHVSR